jgi:hypothetical protein
VLKLARRKGLIRRAALEGLDRWGHLDDIVVAIAAVGKELRIDRRVCVPVIQSIAEQASAAQRTLVRQILDLAGANTFEAGDDIWAVVMTYATP